MPSIRKRSKFNMNTSPEMIFPDNEQTLPWHSIYSILQLEGVRIQWNGDHLTLRILRRPLLTNPLAAVNLNFDVKVDETLWSIMKIWLAF